LEALLCNVIKLYYYVVLLLTIDVGGLFRLRGTEKATCPNIQSRIMVPLGPEAQKQLRVPRTYICNIDFILVIFVLSPFCLANKGKQGRRNKLKYPTYKLEGS